ncbi:ATP-binding protein [Alkalihalobacillus sp. 1P02AB]|uniref:ATP-binding protein n=1 Tax=Alkalihalobacillus sp. 1P02AB TaxID=3132260 RepID=UPI0039A542E3
MFNESIILFEIPREESVGQVVKVDSYSVTINIPDDDILKSLNVNGFVILHTSNPNVRLIGRIDRVLRIDDITQYSIDGGVNLKVSNSAIINALGTLYGPNAERKSAQFTRAVEVLPEIGADCFYLSGKYLSSFTTLIASENTSTDSPLTLGAYAISNESKAILDGNAFFQRHAMIVGSTGSGKSYTVAKLVEQAASLEHANMIIFDLHGEYAPLAKHKKIKQFRIAGPGDLNESSEEVLYLPYWLLGYEDMLALILDRTDENAPNQAMVFSSTVLEAKRNYLEELNMQEELETFTIDSPIPYKLDYVIEKIVELNNERVQGSRGMVNGPFKGKFDRFIPRIISKMDDRRYGFLFSLDEEKGSSDYLIKLVKNLMEPSAEDNSGVKIINFSEVPSDILPIVISLVARIVFQIQQWTPSERRYPISLICDEAHLYLPAKQLANASEVRALEHFERIAKEGRKYGVSLTIISQRPSELNTTIMSQCNNVIALRLANQSDKNAVSNLLPENLGGIKEVLPILGVGEGIVVGDSCILPFRIKIEQPVFKPKSNSLKFWSVWKQGQEDQKLKQSVINLQRQTLE